MSTTSAYKVLYIFTYVYPYICTYVCLYHCHTYVLSLSQILCTIFPCAIIINPQPRGYSSLSIYYGLSLLFVRTITVTVIVTCTHIFTCNTIVKIAHYVISMIHNGHHEGQGKLSSSDMIYVHTYVRMYSMYQHTDVHTYDVHLI